MVSLGSTWAPLGHFGPLSGKRCEKRSQIDLQLDLQMGRFSVHVLYLVYFEGVMAGARRTPGSGYFSCSVFWHSGKRNMELTTVFTVPNAHHIFGSRHRFSEFVVPSGIHFGDYWIAFSCLLESTNPTLLNPIQYQPSIKVIPSLSRVPFVSPPTPPPPIHG